MPADFLYRSLADFLNYSRSGFLLATGFEPHGLPSNQWTMPFSNQVMQTPRARSNALFGMPRIIGANPNVGWMTKVGSAIGPIVVASDIVSGYREAGISGAIENAVKDVATGAVLYRFSYRKAATAAGVRVVSKGFLSLLGRGAVGYAGAELGGSVLGLPGMFAGAYIGAGAAPLIAAGAGVALGSYAVGYGGYQLLKQGYRYRQMQKGINTSGDLSAFMTQGAFSQRERAVQAISKSFTNARSALGQEANFLHHPSRNYHSRYRSLL